jgi:hypothetical protein
MDRRSGFYRKMSAITFECFVYFRYMPAHQSYDVTIGVQSVQIRKYLGKALHATYGEDFARKFLDPLETPCLSMFNADALVKWRRGEMSAASEQSLALEMADLFRQAVEPIFERVHNHQEMLALLLRDDAPFAWWRSSVSPRLAQIVARASATKSEWSTIRDRIKPAEVLLANDTLAASRGKSFIKDLYEYCSEHQPTVAA